MKRLIRLLIISALTIIGLALPSAARAQVNTDQVMRIGQNAIYFEDYILAIQYFNQVIQAKPYLPKPYYMRGWAKFYLDDYAGAEADASAALDINPYITDSHRLRGAARHNLGKYDLAVEDYDIVLADSPNDDILLYNKAKALTGGKHYNEAEAVYDHLLRIDPKAASAYFGRASVKLLANDTISAKADLEKGLEYNSSDISGQYMKYIIARDFDKDNATAIAALDKMVSLEPANTDIRLMRANMRYIEYDYADAVADLTYVLHLEPDNDIALYNRAVIRTQLYDLDNALDDFSAILRNDPTNDFALYNRANIYAIKGDYGKAVDDITEFIRLYPDLPTSYFVRSQWLLETGEKKRAKADYDKALALADSSRPIRRQTRHKTLMDSKYRDNGTDESTPSDTEELTPEEFERRLTTLIDVDDDPTANKYESSSIRGSIQNHNFDIDIEPMMQLSYYATPTELQRKTYYIKEVDDINNADMLRRKIFVAMRPPMLTMSQMQELTDNVEYYNSYISTHTPRSIDYIDRALSYITLRNIAPAVSDLNHAIDLTPDHPVAYMLRAQARNFDYDPDVNRSTALKLMLADLDKAIELSPRNAVAWYNKGNVLFEMGDYAGAAQAYSTAIEYQPDMGEAYFNRGYAYLKNGKSLAGKDDLSKAGELGIVPAYNLMKRITTRN